MLSYFAYSATKCKNYLHLAYLYKVGWFKVSFIVKKSFVNVNFRCPRGWLVETLQAPQFYYTADNNLPANLIAY
jgi:hypothetical protein